MKILIIEDMHWIREGIVQLVKKGDHAFEAVWEAEDGQEGLQCIQRESPDIVITDIRMPQMDGLELIQQAQKINGNMLFIIVTGHAEFDYAKRAIDLGVIGFVLKPIDPERFEAILDKAVSRHERLHAVKSMEEERGALEQYQRDQEINRRINRIFLNKESVPMHLGEGMAYGMIYIHTSKAVEGIRSCISNTISRSRIKILHRIIENVINSKEWFVILYDAKESAVSMALNCIATMLEETLRDKDDEVFIDKGETVEDISYPMYHTIKNRFIREVFSTHVKDDEAAQVLDIKESLRFLHKNIQAKDYHQVKAIINRLFANKALQRNTRTRIIVMYSLISSAFFEAFNIPMQEIEGNNLFKSSYIIEHCNTIEEIRDSLIGLLDDLIRGNASTCFDKNDMSHVKEYIDNHYTEGITVKSLAGLWNVSSSYLSSSFKKQYAISPFSYITTLRMDKACKLLRESDYHISNISEAVGYGDVQHFYRVFKKHVGATPLQYRSNPVRKNVQ